MEKNSSSPALACSSSDARFGIRVVAPWLTRHILIEAHHYLTVRRWV